MWYVSLVSRLNLPPNHVNVFYFIRIMSLHNLVKLEMFIAHVLPLSCYRKKLDNVSHLNCGFQIRYRFESSYVSNTAREGVQSMQLLMHHWVIWTN